MPDGRGYTAILLQPLTYTYQLPGHIWYNNVQSSAPLEILSLSNYKVQVKARFICQVDAKLGIHSKMEPLLLLIDDAKLEGYDWIYY